MEWTRVEDALPNQNDWIVGYVEDDCYSYTGHFDTKKGFLMPGMMKGERVSHWIKLPKVLNPAS
jgi:hypothetical protein